MNSIFEIKNEKDLHHFYLIKSSLLDTKEIKNYFSKIFISQFDFFEFNYDIILVDHAREIINLANRKIAENKKHLFFIKTNSINLQAQNSLLKSLEEPTKNLYFFFVLPELNNILPTILSRAFVLNENEKSHYNFDDFWQLKLAEKISFVEKISSEIKDGKKIKQDAINLADFIIQKLNEDLTFKKKIIKKFNK